MQQKEVAHYCQKCLAANPLGQDFCTRCGTRLMIVVEPVALRYENTESTVSSEEHLLERISILENRLTRLTERLERGLDLLLRQAQNSYFDRALLKSLISLLTESGVVGRRRLEQVWQDRCAQDAAEQEESNRREQLRTRILSSYRGSSKVAFEQYVNDGFLLIEDEKPKRGFRLLQRAVEMAQDNAPLILFVGEHFFRAGNTKLACDYLTRAFEAAPDDTRVSLLLGLACGDEGDTERAKELLDTATRRGGSSFAAHYGLGRLFVAEQNWREALREFKRALVTRPSPEAHYALGCLYYRLCRDTMAARHLRKAVEMDESYGEAFYLLGLSYTRTGQNELAQRAFAKAKASHRSRKRPPTEVPLVPPLFEAPVDHPHRLMTGADKRVAEAIREDALKTFVERGANRQPR